MTMEFGRIFSDAQLHVMTEGDQATFCLKRIFFRWNDFIRQADYMA